MLYDPETKTIYTPNTNKTSTMNENQVDHDEERGYNPNRDNKGRFSGGGRKKTLTKKKNGDNLQSSLNPESAKDANKFRIGFTKKTLDEHWGGSRDHSSEYPGFTKEEYAKRALELVQMPVGGNILGYMNDKGLIIRYDKETNDFVKGHPKHGIATLFKPKNKEKYYLKQEKENGSIDVIKDGLICPVCGKCEFEYKDFYEVCKICGWEDDGTQRDDPDYEGGANVLSLNQYKKAYQEGGLEKAKEERQIAYLKD